MERGQAEVLKNEALLTGTVITDSVWRQTAGCLSFRTPGLHSDTGSVSQQENRLSAGGEGPAARCYLCVLRGNL